MNILEKTGLSDIYDIDDFTPKQITLRDGSDSVLWVNKNDNHGILDEQSWEDESFYCEDYRNESSAKLDQYTSPEEHLDIYKKLNYRQFRRVTRPATLAFAAMYGQNYWHPAYFHGCLYPARQSRGPSAQPSDCPRSGTFPEVR